MQQAAAVAARSDAMLLARAYQELTKPGITLFVGLTAIAGYVLNAGGNVQFGTLCLVMLTTMMMSGGAATLNHVAEQKTWLVRSLRNMVPQSMEGHLASSFTCSASSRKKKIFPCVIVSKSEFEKEDFSHFPSLDFGGLIH